VIPESAVHIEVGIVVRPDHDGVMVPFAEVLIRVAPDLGEPYNAAGRICYAIIPVGEVSFFRGIAIAGISDDPVRDLDRRTGSSPGPGDADNTVHPAGLW
jgi:hypothetical protein